MREIPLEIAGTAEAVRNDIAGTAVGRWAVRAGKRARRWLEVIADAEALASLASLGFDHPSWGWPELEAQPRFEAKALGHPLIADGKRVPNDVAFEGGGRALVVTGSNMAGKSTLLRAIGVNAVLALSGTVACAASSPNVSCLLARIRMASA